MHIKKIVGQLLDVLDSEKSKKKKQVKAVEKLVSKLEKKERRIKHNLKSADSKKEIKTLERKLKLCKEHHKKGIKALKEMS